MTTLIARRRDADFPKRKFVGHTEKTPVRACVGAKAFLPQEINRDEATDKQKRDRDCDGRERGPKICGHQMIREFRDDWFVCRLRKDAIRNGPNKHVKRSAERHIHKEPRPERLRMQSYFL